MPVSQLHKHTNAVFLPVYYHLPNSHSPLLELANYHILGRIFHYVPHLTPLPPGKVMPIFGGLMAVVEALNALGVALQANPTGDQQELGKILILAALALQLCVIVTFVGIAGIFHWRCKQAKIHRRSLPTLLVTLYISMLLILIRCIYRLVEHVGNTEVDLDDFETLRALSPLLRHEWFFIVFEACLMLINSVLWNVFNPGRYLPQDRAVHLASDGMTETKANVISDNRPIYVQITYLVLNTLTFGLLRLCVRPEDEEAYPLTERSKDSTSDRRT